MINSISQLKHDPRKLSDAYFRLAKRWWGVALCCKVAVIATGGMVVWLSILSKPAPFIVFALTVLSEWFMWRSDKTKGIAESLLRKLDFRDSLGWPISREEMSDILARTPARLRRQIPPEGPEATYFASQDERGPRRALRNVQESAWWSKHLTEIMGRYLLIFTSVSVIGSLLILLVSVGTLNNFDALSGVGRVVTSVLMLVLSLGLIRLAGGYHKFNQKAQQVESRAGELLQHGCTEIDAVKLYSEYHLDRAASPLIPDRIWERNRDHLNELWKDYRTD